HLDAAAVGEADAVLVTERDRGRAERVDGGRRVGDDHRAADVAAGSRTGIHQGREIPGALDRLVRRAADRGRRGVDDSEVRFRRDRVAAGIGGGEGSGVGVGGAAGGCYARGFRDRGGVGALVRGGGAAEERVVRGDVATAVTLDGGVLRGAREDRRG